MLITRDEHQLAKKGAEQPGSCLNVSGTLCNARRVLRTEVLESWHEYWIDSKPDASPYNPADTFPPRHRPSWHLEQLPRKLFGLVLQCRTGHGFMGEYDARHVPDEDVAYHCGVGLQTRAHILQSCPSYDRYRHIPFMVAEDCDVPEILGSKNGIKAL